MYSALAGTSRSTVSALTSSRGFWRRKPEIKYSSTSGGAGTIAENVVAGSVPMATATSMRSSRILVTVVGGRVSREVEEIYVFSAVDHLLAGSVFGGDDFGEEAAYLG